MPFNKPTYEELLEQNKANVRAKFADASLLSRSFLTVFVKVLSMTTYGLYGFGEWIFKQIFIDTADPENLVRHARNRGKERKDASRSKGKVVVTGTNGSILPVNSELKRADGEMYQTTVSAVIAEGQAVVEVESVNAGALGNCESGTVLTLTEGLEGVAKTATVSTAGITGGYDVEDIEELRARLKSYVQKPPLGGSDSDYVSWAKEVAGVTRAWCYPCAMGLGTVVVRFVMDNKAGSILPDENEIQSVYDYIKSKVPATVLDLYVLAPTAKVVNVVINDLNPNDDDTKSSIISNLSDVFLSSEPAKTLKLNAVRNAVITVTEDHVLVAPSSDIHTNAAELAVLGTVTFGSSSS